jgi:type IV pilus assembly protein PilB
VVEQAVKGRLGDRLIERGLLSEEQLQVGLREQRRFHRPLGEILVSVGFVTQADITRLVAEDLGVEFLQAHDIKPDPILLSAIDPVFVRETLTFPIGVEQGVLRVVMVDPDNPRKLAEIRARFPFPLSLAITTEGELLKLIRLHLTVKTSRVAEIMTEIAAEGRDIADVFPVEAVTHAILIDGIHRHATDIHVEPEDRVTRVRYRVDGILQGGENLPAAVTPAIVSRIKILSHLDIAERRRPQDGRLRLELEDRAVDMRVSIMPCNFGENVVLRVLESGNGVLRLSHLGVSEPHQRVLAKIVQRPHGLFLVTGPTGSGKTTTLYAMLSVLDAMRDKVATIEDPIEYRLPLLRQSQVDPAIGFTFSTGLRSLLRQDPDIILVGEVRDQETAEIAIKAALTGHLVLSTLHTNSAIGAIPRLIDMGIERYLVEDSLIGSMSQRLVRRVCPACSVEFAANESECSWLGVEAALLRRGRGCERCDGSGYQGRLAIVEIFLPDAEIAAGMRKGLGIEEIDALARTKGFKPLVEDGKRLVLAGDTTMDEILRVGRDIRLSADERAGI